tara:strand:- start:3926 stop:4603 length:678 start_codon:yes stop_codon:yes gene_type:complete
MSTNIKKINVILEYKRNADWMKNLKLKLSSIRECDLEIDCEGLFLNCKDLMLVKSICEKSDLNISLIKSTIVETIISAKSLALEAELYIKDMQNNFTSYQSIKESKESIEGLHFHQGTVRSGEHVQSNGDLFILGDINPGGLVSANGDVMVWGRLLGIAHAGKSGNSFAKISALQLKPVQLRIANKVARGPKESQEPGIAEQAEISNELIVIKPLNPIYKGLRDL